MAKSEDETLVNSGKYFGEERQGWWKGVMVVVVWVVVNVVISVVVKMVVRLNN